MCHRGSSQIIMNAQKATGSLVAPPTSSRQPCVPTAPSAQGASRTLRSTCYSHSWSSQPAMREPRPQLLQPHPWTDPHALSLQQSGPSHAGRCMKATQATPLEPWAWEKGAGRWVGLLLLIGHLLQKPIFSRPEDITDRLSTEKQAK